MRRALMAVILVLAGISMGFIPQPRHKSLPTPPDGSVTASSFEYTVGDTIPRLPRLYVGYYPPVPLWSDPTRGALFIQSSSKAAGGHPLFGIQCVADTTTGRVPGRLLNLVAEYFETEAAFQAMRIVSSGLTGAHAKTMIDIDGGGSTNQWTGIDIQNSGGDATDTGLLISMTGTGSYATWIDNGICEWLRSVDRATFGCPVEMDSTVVITCDKTNGTGIDLDHSGNGGTALWVTSSGTNGYGVYVDDGFNEFAATCEELKVSCPLKIEGTVSFTDPIIRGQATIPAANDTVRVSTSAVAGPAFCQIQLTAHLAPGDTLPDGSFIPIAGELVYCRVDNGNGFTIGISGDQQHDLTVKWFLIKHN
jgi:hypothetical protein